MHKHEAFATFDSSWRKGVHRPPCADFKVGATGLGFLKPNPWATHQYNFTETDFRGPEPLWHLSSASELEPEGVLRALDVVIEAQFGGPRHRGQR